MGEMTVRRFSSQSELDSNLARDLAREYDPGTRNNILLLLSGGSVIPSVVESTSKGCEACLSMQHIGLADERFVDQKSADSILESYRRAGLDLQKDMYSHVEPVFETSDQLEKVTREYEDWLIESMGVVDRSVGIFGIGVDGHTAGIKPMSDANTFTELFLAGSLVASYEADDYQRLTVTGRMIEQLDKAYLYAGTGKANILKEFIETDTPAPQMPAQLLKRAKQLMVYTLE